MTMPESAPLAHARCMSRQFDAGMAAGARLVRPIRFVGSECAYEESPAVANDCCLCHGSTNRYVCLSKKRRLYLPVCQECPKTPIGLMLN
eukprot:scaffold164814_cov13-Prasinocladus_malaysianus.AAC.1